MLGFRFAVPFIKTVFICALCIAVPAQMFGSAAVANLGTVAVGSHGSGSITIPLPTAPAAGTTVSLHYGTDFTVGGCMASGSACVVAITFTPTSVGLTQDAVIVKDSSGHVLAEGFLYGKGDGPQVTFSPGSVHVGVEELNGKNPVHNFAYVVADQAGNLYASDSMTLTVVKFESVTSTSVVVAGQSGSYGYSGDGGPATSALLSAPGQLAIDGAGNLYVADGPTLIRRIDAVTGMITTVAGQNGNASGSASADGSLATSGRVTAGALAISARGDLYLSDVNSSSYFVVRKIDGVTGIITTVAGGETDEHTGVGGPALAAGFSGISGLALSSSDDLYVAEQTWIWKIDAATQIITIVAGTGVPGYAGDGGLATNAALFVTILGGGIAVDAFDNLYLNNLGTSLGLAEIRKINAATGIINTISNNNASDTANHGLYDGAPANYVTAGALGCFDRMGNMYLPYGAELLEVNNQTPSFISPASSLSISVNNAGSQTLSLTSEALSGSISQQSAGSSCSFPGSVVAGGSCALSLTATGDTAPSQGLLTILDNAGNSPNFTQYIPLSFQQAQVSGSSSYNFGNVDVSEEAQAQAVLTLTTSGLTPFEFDHLVIQGPNASEYSATVSGSTVTVDFFPRGLGLRSASLVIYGNTANPITIALSGNGISTLVISSLNLNFAQGQWAAAEPQTVVISNQGQSRALFAAATMTSSGVFQVQDNCAATTFLYPGQSCTVVVNFNPAGQVGTFTGSYQLTSAPYQTITFQARAVPTGPTATLGFGATSPLSFTASMKESSAAVPLSLQNSGGSAAAISSVTITGAQASDFHQSNDCPSLLPAGGSCVIWISYTPSASSPLVSTANVVVTGSVAISQGLTGTLLTDALPRVMIEYPTAGSAPVSGVVNFSGWAGQDFALLGNVSVLIDGALVEVAYLSNARADVCSAYPNMGDCPNTGWQASYDTGTLANGPHTLTIIAGLSSGQQTHASVQFKVANVVSFMGPVIESPTQGQIVSSTITFSGWYVAGSEPYNSLAVTLDGGNYPTAIQRYARPDVCAALKLSDCNLAVGWYFTYTPTSFRSAHTLSVTHFELYEDGQAPTTSQTVSFTTTSPVLPAPSIILSAPTVNQSVGGSLTVSGSYRVPVTTGTGASLYNIEVLIGGLDLGSIYFSTSCAQQPATSCLTANFSETVPLTAVFSGPQTLTIRADTTGDGPYSVTVPINVSSLVSDATDQLLLNVEAPGANAVLSGKASVSGWVVDGVTAYPEVDLMMDGVPVGSTSAQYSRPDVCAAYPWGVSCPTAGWLASIDTTTLADGSHALTIASTSALGKRVVKTVPFVSSNNSGRAANGEFLNIESPTAGQKVSGALSVSGWAVSAASVVTEVDVFVDGLPVGTAVYNQARPDVCKAYPNSKGCPGVGWYFLLDTRTLADGAHTVKAVGVTANGSSIMTQNFTVANAGVSTKIRAVIDAPVGNATLSGDALVSGWAIDDADSISSVQINVDGFPQGFATYGGPRVDVCNVFPGRVGCPDVGWYLPIDTTQFLNGMHTLDVVVTSTHGDVETLTRVFLVAN